MNNVHSPLDWCWSSTNRFHWTWAYMWKRRCWCSRAGATWSTFSCYWCRQFCYLLFLLFPVWFRYKQWFLCRLNINEYSSYNLIISIHSTNETKNLSLNKIPSNLQEIFQKHESAFFEFVKFHVDVWKVEKCYIYDCRSLTFP